MGHLGPNFCAFNTVQRPEMTDSLKKKQRETQKEILLVDVSVVTLK